MRTRSYSMDTEGESDSGTDKSSGDPTDSDSEFEFDGFKVMFVEKVMLTPVMPVVPPAALTQAQSRRWH